MIASLALITYAVLFFGLIKLIPITLTLPGIAGLILTIGIAADSNIVIFERIKEEMRAGRSSLSAIATGYKRGIATIIDANVVTLITAFILFVLATAGVKGFAFTLGVGTIVSLFTAVLFTQAVLSTMGRSKLLHSPAMLGAGERHLRVEVRLHGQEPVVLRHVGLHPDHRVACRSRRRSSTSASTSRAARASRPPSSATSPSRTCATRSSRSGSATPRSRRSRTRSSAITSFRSRRRSSGPAGCSGWSGCSTRSSASRSEGFSSESVGPTFGETVARSAGFAIVASLLLIMGYVALRFEPKFAIPVMIALFHDLLITAGVYSLTGREVTTSTVAAILTILGYSLYDVVIVFDRIRENAPRMPRAAFSQIVNRSMSDVLTRSLATSMSTLMGVAAIFLFGGETLKDFAFALLVGIVSGTYSSIFIAAPVLTEWKEREPAFKQRRRRIEADLGYVPAYPLTPGAACHGRARARATARTAARRSGGRRAAPEPASPGGDDAPRARGGTRRAAPMEPMARTAHLRTSPRSSPPRWAATAPTLPTPATPMLRARSAPSARSSASSASARAASTGGGVRMNFLVWVMMGIAVWHFAVFVPDRFWGGIVGAFGAAAVGAVAGRGAPGRRRDRRPQPADGPGGDPGCVARPGGLLVRRRARAKPR